jgi:hypothetical protein
VAERSANGLTEQEERCAESASSVASAAA